MSYKKRPLCLAASVLASLVASESFAASMSHLVSSFSPFVASLSVGPAWTKGGDTQTIYLQEDVFKTYTANRESRSLADAELFLAKPYSLSRMIQAQFGLVFGLAGHAKLAGDIWEDADPDFNNFSYTYKVNQARLGLKGKLLADVGYWVQPYVSGSVGVGFNKAYDFRINPKISSEVPAPPFTNHTSSSFAYTLGVGAQAPFNDHWSAGVGYQFTDWGKSRLNRAPGQTLDTGIQLSNLTTNGIQFTISYAA